MVTEFIIFPVRLIDNRIMPWRLSISPAAMTSLSFPVSVSGTNIFLAPGLPKDLKRFSALTKAVVRSKEDDAS